MIGIYKLTSPSGKIYIGQSWNVKKRLCNYKNLYCKTQTKLYNSLKKHGFDNHIIDILQDLPEDTTQNVMDTYEKFYIDQYKECGYILLNLREAGSRGRHSEETKKKMCGRVKLVTEHTKSLITEGLKKHFKKNGSHNDKKIIQIDPISGDIKTWNSAKQAAKELGFNNRGISKAVTGRNKDNKYKDYIWKFN